MKQLLLLLTLTIGVSTMAQQTTAKTAFLEKWQNSKDYLIAMVDAIPEDQYDFKPTERQRSFVEQLEHMDKNMNWLGSTYFGMEAGTFPKDADKLVIMGHLEASFDAVYKAVENTPDEDLSITVDFFAGPKSKLQILNLLQDHMTHHRGQLIVYLNLQGIEPPRYVGW